MQLIYTRGHNCHLAALVSIANALGVNHLEAYAALWSETEFADETDYRIFTSRRVLQHLSELGVKMDPLQQEQAALEQFQDGALFLVGMDTFLIPWHPVFSHFHGPHYFFAQKNSAHALLCYDPIYGASGDQLNFLDVAAGAFDLTHVTKVEATPLRWEPALEARAVLRGHPKTKEKWLEQMARCKAEGKRNAAFVIKQINALLNNRYLYRQFFCSRAAAFGCGERFFSDRFFSAWEALRVGLHKTVVVKDNSAVVDEVCRLFAGLMEEEISMAKEIIAARPSAPDEQQPHRVVADQP